MGMAVECDAVKVSSCRNYVIKYHQTCFLLVSKYLNREKNLSRNVDLQATFMTSKNSLLQGTKTPHQCSSGSLENRFLWIWDRYGKSRSKTWPLTLWQTGIYLTVRFSCITFQMCTNMSKQESPPAWTQEAYRPPCSEYSFCCPTWVPPPGGVRVPPRGGPGTPPGGYPVRYPPGGSGYPPGGYPVRYPPRGGPGTPPAASWHSGKCCKALWDMGTPPGVDRQTKWNYYLPVVLRTRAVTSLLSILKHFFGGVKGF